jgi:hypothetical protein
VVVGLLDVLVLKGVGLLVIGHESPVHLRVLHYLDPVLPQEVHVAQVHQDGLLEHPIVLVDFPTITKYVQVHALG